MDSYRAAVRLNPHYLAASPVDPSDGLINLKILTRNVVYQGRWLILVYHKLAEVPDYAPPWRVTVGRRYFSDYLFWLKQTGYTVDTVYNLARRIHADT